MNQVLTPTLYPNFLLLDPSSKLLNSELSEHFSYDAENGTCQIICHKKTPGKMALESVFF